MVAWIIAGCCVIGFIVVWFATVRKELLEKRRNLTGLREQLLMHKEASVQVRDGPDSKVAEKMLETNRRIYHEAAKSYNRLLKKPLNRLPALLMHFRFADESGNVGAAK